MSDYDELIQENELFDKYIDEDHEYTFGPVEIEGGYEAVD